MADQDYRARIDAIAKQLSNLQTGLQPVATQQAALTSTVVSLRSELAAVATTVASGLLKREVHKHLDLPEEEVSANFFLSAEPPPLTDASVRWLSSADLVRSPSGVPPVSFIKPQPGSQVRPCFSSTPSRQVNERPVQYHVEGDFGVRARAVKDRSVGRDYDRAVPMADMIERLIQGFEMLVRMPDLPDEYRRHALAFMRFGQLVVSHEYSRIDHLLLLTDDPTNRRALQFSASIASAGSGIAGRFLTNKASAAYAKAGLSTPSQPFKKEPKHNQNPAGSAPHEKRHKDASNS